MKYKCIIGDKDDPDWECTVEAIFGHSHAAEKAAAKYENDAAEYDNDSIKFEVTDENGAHQTVTVHCEYSRDYWT